MSVYVIVVLICDKDLVFNVFDGAICLLLDTLRYLKIKKLKKKTPSKNLVN